jgi:hypothetical protein
VHDTYGPNQVFRSFKSNPRNLLGPVVVQDEGTAHMMGFKFEPLRARSRATNEADRPALLLAAPGSGTTRLEITYS